MTEQEFGARLRQFRKDKRMTQQELADALGVSNKSISRWESGAWPDAPTLPTLAKALGISTDTLLGCEPPLRKLQTPEWQNLLSYAFMLGGGVLFYLFDLFTPTLVCYLLYLTTMAYGVYLHRHYTYHSRWFYAANVIMNLSVNLRLISAVLVEIFYWPNLSTIWMEIIVELHGQDTNLDPQDLLFYFGIPVALTLLTHLVIWRTYGEDRLRLRLHREKALWRALVPALCPVILALFWLPYLSRTPLPGWAYGHQMLLFGGAWLVLALAATKYLTVIQSKNRIWAFLPIQLICLCFPALTTQQRSYNFLKGTLVPRLINPRIYYPFREPVGSRLWIMCAVLMLLYIAACVFRISLERREKE